MFYAYDEERKVSSVGGFGRNSYITGRKSTGAPSEEDLHFMLPSAILPKATGSVVVKLDAFYTSAL
jgi:hypothetical protein